ncbi:hypothetical protein SCP_0310470 [Sparassis crispa]|uniref:BSD domain-containing protein n=1 Tax=Sparassis crispa TaxID=139825 RepID=A0A401GGK7_9APHY|nr:hypothetical protein SCP_0310470 [Sparassis crispa]GBE81320.1 hypothetical protein SCP_0310470 [Sparassis crispa]
MNFFDAYDISGPSTPTSGQQAEPSLNEEVSQVVGQLSRFWGGFRKQSQTVFEAARKDIGDAVSQAQKEINKLTTETLASTSTQEDHTGTEQTDQLPSAGESSAAPESNSAYSASASTIAEGDSRSTTPTETQPQPQTIFSRLQASLPPNLVSSVQSQLPDSLQHARAGSLSALDFAQLRSTLTTELHRVQDATGEYVQRSEELFREAGEFLKDAVKVLPPEESGGVSPGLIWDGSDVWMLPTEGSAGGRGELGSRKGKEREGRASSSSGRPSVEKLRAVATRAESLLKQLKHDPEVVKVDPQSDERVRHMFASWVESEVDAQEGGINSVQWKDTIENALTEPVDGAALKSTFDTLVPSVITSDMFWVRYFFRVHQVEREEERRKAIIQGTAQNEEDFSWDDDDDTTSTAVKAPLVQLHQDQTSDASDASALQAVDNKATLVAEAATPTQAPKSRVSTPGNQSPRESEDSYDVVSSQVSNYSGGIDSKAQSPSLPETPAPTAPVEDDPDSDWE